MVDHDGPTQITSDTTPYAPPPAKTAHSVGSRAREVLGARRPRAGSGGTPLTVGPGLIGHRLCGSNPGPFEKIKIFVPNGPCLRVIRTGRPGPWSAGRGLRARQ
jgi:hypothetical protein